ncbi:hypothetical protein C8Q75DRAFT_774654 [Abortiporus biennis]|nr:hypothetical protein C8Q75DRAFT_774654 [Abortiporus biennis]
MPILQTPCLELRLVHHSRLLRLHKQQTSATSVGYMVPSSAISNIKSLCLINLLAVTPGYKPVLKLLKEEFTALETVQTYPGSKFNDLVITTLPLKPLNEVDPANPTFKPKEKTECILYAPTKYQIFCIPGFPEEPRHLKEKPYKIQDLPGRGKGLIATQQLEMGDLILAERPFIIIPACWPVALSQADMIKYQRDVFREQENMLKRLLDRMDPADRAAFMTLDNCLEEGARSGPILDRIHTNSFGIHFDDEGSNDFMKDGEVRMYSVVGKDISRVNHSCCPNAMFNFDKPSFSMELRAVRGIRKGEEITVCYHTGDIEPTAERQKLVAPYRFTCTCPACLSPTATDAQYALIRQITMENIKGTPIDVALRSLAVIEKHGLESNEIYFLYLMYVMQYYEFKKDKQKELEFRYKVFRRILAVQGRRQAAASTVVPDLPQYRSWKDFI